MNAGPAGDPGLRFIKRSTRARPKVSLILLDWSVRESFHLAHYLARQDVPRDDFEVIVIEYYSRVSDAVRRVGEHVDTWVTLGMPEQCYYHKHLMYNAGFVLARGELCVICDSDAMAKPGFIRAIVEAFERDPGIILHLDQFRNSRKEHYPFNFPSFEEVEGSGCINYANGKTVGVASDEDRIHSRNYGACMCARRDDLIAIGGADEHIDFLGHICGPYDMTFRLINVGRKEIWHQTEFLYHTWHPGQDGTDNYLGPNDGRNMSTRSLEALCTGRVRPLVENAAIRALRERGNVDEGELLGALIRPECRHEWLRAKAIAGALHPEVDSTDTQMELYRGFLIFKDGDRYYAHLSVDSHRGRAVRAEYLGYVEGASLEEIKSRIQGVVPLLALIIAQLCGSMPFIFALRGAIYVLWRIRNARLRLLRALNARLNPLLELFQRLLNQFKSLFGWGSLALARQFAEGQMIGNVLPCLYYLGRAARRGTPRSEILVIVERQGSELCLRALSMLGFFPKIRVIRISEPEQLLETMRQAGNWDGAGLILITRELYLRSYYLVPPGRVGKQVVTF